MSEPNGYLLHGTAFSSKKAAFEILVHNHEQELRFHKIWDEDVKPYYFEPQPQLTIPKSIADELDLHEINWQDGDLVFRVCNALPCKVEDWFDSDYNSNVAMAYLVGKALGVDLVKVVEG